MIQAKGTLTDKSPSSHAFGVQRNRQVCYRKVAYAILAILLALSGIMCVSAASTEVTHVTVRPGDTIYVSCTRPALQGVYVHGNLSQVELNLPTSYPASQLSLVAIEPGSTDLTVSFQHQQDYKIDISAGIESGNVRDVDTYYLSSGQFTLEIAVSILSSPTKVSEFQMPSTRDFSNWLFNFGRAFPLWTKLLYVFLGFQFLFVGYERISFNDRRRRDRRLRLLDFGNKTYVWIDVMFKFLLTCLAVTAVLMVGQVIILAILRTLFLAAINLPSIWNLFVLGFLAVISLCAYLLRTILGHKFDLAPMEVD